MVRTGKSTSPMLKTQADRSVYSCKHQTQEPRIVHDGCSGVAPGKSRCDGFRFGALVQVLDNQDCDSCKEKSKYKVFKDRMIVGTSGNESLKDVKVDDDGWDMVEHNAELDFEEGMIVVGTKRQRDAVRGLTLC